MGAVPQLTSIIESALIATAFRLSVSRARSARPVTRPPIGDPEQSAALKFPKTVYGWAGVCPSGYVETEESLCSWSSLRLGGPDTQELKIRTAIGEKKIIRDTWGAFLFMS